MYPATIFNWHDNSSILQENTPAVVDDSPLFYQPFSADKGTEDLVEISGDDFDKMYGTLYFEKHGQSAIQAKHIIDAGGRLLVKRVVAHDATLANVVLVATVSEDSGKAKIKWEAKEISGCKTYDEVVAAAKELLDDENGVYPLIIFSDNGRGVSGKSVSLVPDYSTSKTIGKTFYTLVVHEGTTITERTTVALDPTVIYDDKSYRLEKYSSVQVSGCVDEDIYESFLNKLGEIISEDLNVLRSYDLIFGYTNRGASYDKITVDAESVDIDSEVGISLSGGDNGAFGNAPVGTEEWTKALCAAFGVESDNYTVSDEIWDVDTHKLALVLDANYPIEVKNAIFEFVTFRKDCSYLRDFGLGLNTFLEIKEYYMQFEDYRNYFVSDYMTNYMIKDPVSKKNINVTMMYDMAAIMVNHIAETPFSPMAGFANDFVLSSAIKGTVNYTPVVTPKVNQKEAIDELRVNYAIFEDDNLVVQSEYTSQIPYTQLSFTNNVVAIQRVLRAVRTACPKQRFTLTTGEDFETYAAAVNNVLSNYITNFSQLNFKYTADPIKTSQKIFYASIEFAFLNWAQTEIFDVYAINN